jgi:L-ascorbate metabolism protein UlaG (beta-lactamase superfamily)
MKLQYIGHSCFELQSKNGARVVTDPFDSSIGIDMPHLLADVVTVSHQHHDHNNLSIIIGNYLSLNEIGEYSFSDIKIRGIASNHDDVGGSKRGKNIIFCFDIDGLTVCHLGDLGDVPNSLQLKQIGKVDVLLIPVGEVFTLTVEKAIETCRLINPVITIPMHFKTDALAFALSKPEKFLLLAGNFRDIKISSLELTPENIGDYKGIILLNK